MNQLFLSLILYNFLYILFSPFIIIYFLSRKDSLKHWKEYLALGTEQVRTSPTIVLHGVSVGEVLSLIPLVKLLKEETGISIILTTTIEDAIRISDQHADLFEERLFLPLDFSWTMNRFLNRISPIAIIISETDFWPNLLYQCNQRKIPLYLVNGRISEKISRGAQKTAPLSTELLLSFRKFFVQRDLDAKRLIDIGIPSSKIVIAGNSKYESVLQIKEPPETTKQILDSIKAMKSNIIVGGSTHPGEEEMILSLKKSCQSMNIKLIIAPRIIKRSRSILEIAKKMNLKALLYSELSDSPEPDWDVLIIDLLGELKYIYAVAKIVFIGGTFSTVGGHNFLEAAVHRKPVIAGPDIHNFSEDGSRFIENSALIQVQSKTEFTTKVMELLNSSTGEDTGKKAFKLLMDNQGASKLTARSIVEDLLKSGRISKESLIQIKESKENNGR
jgi:3-deoxy-D-manno-octulosonic-acid transferase